MLFDDIRYMSQITSASICVNCGSRHCTFSNKSVHIKIDFIQMEHEMKTHQIFTFLNDN